jgi:hypothetical protein
VVRCQVRVPGQEHEERRKKSPVFRFGYGLHGRAEGRANGGEDGRKSGGSCEMQWRSYRQFDWRASVMRQQEAEPYTLPLVSYRRIAKQLYLVPTGEMR